MIMVTKEKVQWGCGSITICYMNTCMLSDYTKYVVICLSLCETSCSSFTVVFCAAGAERGIGGDVSVMISSNSFAV